MNSHPLSTSPTKPPTFTRTTPQVPGPNNTGTPRKTQGSLGSRTSVNLTEANVSTELGFSTPLPLRPNAQSTRTPDIVDIPITYVQNYNPLSQSQASLSSSPPSQEHFVKPIFVPDSDSPLDSSGGLGTRAKIAIEDVTADEHGLRRLMKAGSWRAALKLADKCISCTDNPQTVLQYKLCRIISLVKMRMYKNALDEINGIGDFDSPANCYEQYPQFQDRKGSMVPFCMRVLKAELLFLLGSDQSLDPLHDLLAFCRRNIGKYKATDTIDVLADMPNFPKPATLDHASIVGEESDFDRLETDDLTIWQLREHRLIFQIATHLVTQKDYPLAIAMLENMALRAPNNASIISALGRVHLQMGNISAANTLFKKTEQLAGNIENSPIVLMDRGYWHLATEEYKAAIESFDKVLKLQPSNIAAANNRSVCWLYTCELSKAISSLEEIIQRDPENNLDESLIFNLCTLYDLASDRSADKKKNIMALVAKFASDSFDFRVLKINTN